MQNSDLRAINSKEYVLYEDFAYEWLDNILVIKKGFVTDLASIPKFFWGLGNFQPGGLNSDAALVHDSLYQLRGFVSKSYPMVEYYKKRETVAREELRLRRVDCDNIFKKILQDSGVDAFTAGSMYNAVHVFGWMHW